uniref:Uncharacterized protein n=1 Tax=Wolfiporia cocos TaxID=81056 RepID=A0A7G7YDW4_9APHY|nr:hypothetical protein [Wolfiporia cocos]
MRLRAELYRVSGKDALNLSPLNVIIHINEILKIYFSHKEVGFVSPSNIRINPVVSALLWYNELVTGKDSLASNYKTAPDWSKNDEDVLKSSRLGGPLKITGNIVNEFEITHNNHLLMLMLLLEIQLARSCVGMDLELEQIAELDVMYDRLFGLLTGGIRKSISQSRLTLEERIYTGFDTEFRTLDNSNVNLLCCTTAIYSRLVLRIKGLSVNTTIKNAPSDYDRNPIVAPEIRVVIGLLRYLLDKGDIGIINLQKSLRSKAEHRK